jgi:hypothetical protein
LFLLSTFKYLLSTFSKLKGVKSGFVATNSSERPLLCPIPGTEGGAKKLILAELFANF